MVLDKVAKEMYEMGSSRTNKPNSRVMCVSHISDVDGCVCVALIQQVLKGQFLLTSYGNLNECLRRIYTNFDQVYVSDLGINKTTVREFARIRQFAELTYIDHHHIDAEVEESISEMGVTVVHDRRDCAGVLTYNLFEADLPREAGLLACYAAVSDRLERGPVATKLLRRYDREFVLFETMLLSYAIEKADIAYKKKLVPRLSKLKHPHQILGVPKLALEQIDRVADLRRKLPTRAQHIGKVFFVKADGDSAGVIANLLIDVCNAPIGVGYENNENAHVSDLSIRAAPHSRVDLGKKVSRLAERFGGIGGGHPKASGARIPTLHLMDFIRALN